MWEVTKMKSLKALSVLSALLGALIAAPATSAAAGDLSSSCVGPEAKKNLSTCPGGPSKFTVGGKRPAAFKSAPPPRERKDASNTKPTNPTEAMAAGSRDSRSPSSPGASSRIRACLRATPRALRAGRRAPSLRRWRS